MLSLEVELLGAHIAISAKSHNAFDGGDLDSEDVGGVGVAHWACSSSTDEPAAAVVLMVVGVVLVLVSMVRVERLTRTLAVRDRAAGRPGGSDGDQDFQLEPDGALRAALGCEDERVERGPLNVRGECECAAVGFDLDRSEQVDPIPDKPKSRLSKCCVLWAAAVRVLPTSAPAPAAAI